MSESLRIPAGLEAVDADWLTAALRSGGALDGGGHVVAVRPGGPLPGIAVTSLVQRLLLVCDPPAAGPPSLIVKLENPAWKFGPSLYEREVRFYRELASAHALPVPSHYYADWNEDEGTFVLLLEDLSDAAPGHRLEGLDLPEAEAVFDAIAALHGSWWERDTLADWPGKTYTPGRARKLLDTFNTRWPQLLDQGTFEVSGHVAAAVRRVGDEYIDGLLGLSRGPRTLIHSDLHAENLMLQGLRVVLVDWQNAAFGHCAFDVAGAVGCVRADVQREHTLSLLDRYHAALVARGVADYPQATFRKDVAAAIRWLFMGVAGWLVVFEAETPRDAQTVQGHWERLSAAISQVDRVAAVEPEPESEA